MMTYSIKNAISELKKKTTEIKVNIEEAEYLKILIERDISVTAKKCEGYDRIVECPICGETISISSSFCSKCGQRIDKENLAL